MFGKVKMGVHLPTEEMVIYINLINNQKHSGGSKNIRKTKNSR